MFLKSLRWVGTIQDDLAFRIAITVCIVARVRVCFEALGAEREKSLIQELYGVMDDFTIRTMRWRQQPLCPAL